MKATGTFMSKNDVQLSEFPKTGRASTSARRGARSRTRDPRWRSSSSFAAPVAVAVMTIAMSMAPSALSLSLPFRQSRPTRLIRRALLPRPLRSMNGENVQSTNGVTAQMVNSYAASSLDDPVSALLVENEQLRQQLDSYKAEVAALTSRATTSSTIAASPLFGQDVKNPLPQPVMDHKRPLMAAQLAMGGTIAPTTSGEGSDFFGGLSKANREEIEYEENIQSQQVQIFDDEPDPEVMKEEEEHEQSMTFGKLLGDRAVWLVGLLILQSLSGFILGRNEVLLQEHVIIIRFLTMLVGAGGNAGNQASVRVIRGLAVGSINDSNALSFLKRELGIGICLSLILGVVGCIRAAVFATPMLETVAITTSLTMIVMISVVLGALLPLGMKKIGIDPAHSSTTIQVIMDVLGVLLTVKVSQIVLESGFTTKILEWIS